MIDAKYLTHLTPDQRVTLEALFAEEQGVPASRGQFAELPELLDLEHVGLLGYHIRGGEYLTAAGREAVVALAHADALNEDADRAVLAFAEWVAAHAEHEASLGYIGRHRKPETFRGWFVRNLTGTRVTALLLVVAVFVALGIAWVVA